MAKKPTRSDLSQKEYEHRISTIKKSLTRHQLDALFLADYENIYYFTGYQNAVPEIASDQVSGLILDSAGNGCLLEMEWAKEIVEKTSWIGARTYIQGVQPRTDEVISAFSVTFAEMGLRGRKVGVEFGEKLSAKIPTEIFVGILRDSRINFVNGAAALWETRMIKTAMEIERIRKAAQVAGRALRRTFGSFRAGMTEADFASFLSRFMIEEGADRPASAIVNSGPRKGPRLAGAYPSRRKIRRGDYVQVDFGAYYQHYRSDLCRMAYVGTPPKEDTDLWELYVEANKKGTASIKPGVEAHEVFKVMVSVFDEAGLRYPYDLSGHGLGLSTHEPPTLSMGDHTKIQPGMVLSIEPDGVPNSAGVFFNCEDNVVCTEDGAKRLSDLGWDIIRI